MMVDAANDLSNPLLFVFDNDLRVSPEGLAQIKVDAKGRELFFHGFILGLLHVPSQDFKELFGQAVYLFGQLLWGDHCEVVEVMRTRYSCVVVGEMVERHRRSIEPVYCRGRPKGQRSREEEFYRLFNAKTLHLA